MRLPSQQRELTSKLLCAAAAGMLALIASLSGCEKAGCGAQAAAPESADRKAGQDDSAAGSVSLQPEEIARMGIGTIDARQITTVPEVSGFGVVVPHDAVAQAVAELHAAIAAQRQSHAALERARGLRGTPGAMPADTQEATERQEASDRAALQLARQRLSTVLGSDLPWRNVDGSAELLALASGRTKLVRATFPLGSLGSVTPTSLRVSEVATGPGARSWPSSTVWRAPADATMPGKSYFAVLKQADFGEGDHLLVWAPVGAPESGVLVPASAVVISSGEFWFYIEKQAGTFVRTELDADRPTPEGYFVKRGILPGEKIVTSAAGQLLARETNPSTETE